MNGPISNLTVALYGISVAAGAGEAIWGKGRWSAATRWAFGLAVVAHTACIAELALRLQRAPLANLHEALIAFGWAMGALGLGLGYRCWAILFPCALAVGAVLGYASLLAPSWEPLIPALRSNWLLYHVSVSLLAYGAFAIACLADIAFLARRAGEQVPTLRAVGARASAVGFALLTIGIATGAIWANQAWGDYWSWDPKETWALVTWLLYGACLHFRFARRWSERTEAWLSVVAFASVLFTFFGVTYLLPSLHGYAQ